MIKSIESLEDRRLFAGGALDTTFATGGATTLAFRTATSDEVVLPRQLLVDPSGNTYVVATTRSTLQVERLTAAGTPDRAWGRRGALVFVNKVDAGVDKARLDAAGRLLVLSDNTLLRFTSAGAIDTTFGTNGSVGVGGVFSAANDFDVDTADRVVVTGDVATKTRYLTRTGVVRLISKGRLDRTFQSRGVYVAPTATYGTSNETQSSGQFVHALADGSVVVAGTVGYGTQNGSLLPLFNGVRSLKFTADGALDSTYGTAGVGVRNLDTARSDFNTYTQSLLGVRANGAVAIQEYTKPDTGSPFGGNLEIDPQGVVDPTLSQGVSYSAPTDNRLDIGATTAVFTTLADGRELAVLDAAYDLTQPVAVLTAGGGYDTTFNAGNPIVLAPGRYGSINVAAAGTADDKILTARPGTDSASVTINRFLTTGSGTSPTFQTPAAPPVAGGGKLTMPATSLQFNAIYYAKGGDTIDGAALNGSELRVFGADGAHRTPRLISYRVNGDYIIATYRTTDTHGLAWDASDNGLYNVRLIAGTVHESDGTTLAAGTIGAITVRIV